MKKKIRVDVYTGSAKGQSGPKGRRINTLSGEYKPAIYKFYKSATHSQTVGDELKVDNRGSIWRSPVVRYFIPIGVVMVCVGVYWGYQHFLSMTHGDKKKSSTSTVAAGAPSPSSAPSSLPGVIPAVACFFSPPEPLESVKWRLSAVVTTKGGQPVVWITNGRGTRFIDA